MTQDDVVGSDGSDINEHWRYHASERFGAIEPAFQSSGVPGLAFNGERTTLWALTRAIPTLFCLDREGAVLDKLALSLTRAHALGATQSGSLLVVDDARHVVEEIMPDGTVVHTLGIPDDPADTGYLPDDPLSIKRVGRPFNRPAGVTAAAANEVLVSDGYGNARVHHFEAGELIHSWGEPGSGPGQFRLPHGIATDAHGLIYVADRENGRVQVFSPEGSYVREYTGLARPCDVVVSALGDIYVAELDPEGGRVTILGADGDVHTQFPACGDQPAAGAHAIEIDFDGNIYLGLVPRIEARLTYGIVKCRPA